MVRAFRDGDARQVVELLRELLPTQLVTEASLFHTLTAEPSARRRFWVAENENGVVGFARAALAGPSAHDVAGFWLGVTPSERGRGIGSLLFGLIEEHLVENGARKLIAHAGEPAGISFLESRAFERTRETWIQRLDLAQADLSRLTELAAAKAREGFRLVTLRELPERARELHALVARAMADEPSEVPRGDAAFEEWTRTTLEHPDLQLDGTFLALAGEQPVSFSLLNSDRPQRLAENEGTGTHPDFRGRGLARLVKMASAHWAREHEIDSITTGNDSRNLAMLAVNRRLGYRLDHVRPTLVRER